ncbi:hypothetical protein [Salimicrobium flavidum]|uniref:Uncharacterized protein n=1 Tax=Salimicrobium flavidum TaxID=570947 RepID=A0A1N7K931_9BACI|nr:hypothetical protein [Salimicrobium flavidum]SIS58083.1 hypothetical protein SAMN05421687_109120 [Salimicrobium flavidum]
MKIPIIIGVSAFVLFFVLLIIIGASYPFAGSLIISFLIFEIALYHHFKRQKEKHRKFPD